MSAEAARRGRAEAAARGTAMLNTYAQAFPAQFGPLTLEEWGSENAALATAIAREQLALAADAQERQGHLRSWRRMGHR